MVKHVILWNLKDEYDETQKNEIKATIKKELENLKGKIPGLLEMKVQTEKLNSSTGDFMLDSLFESEDALKKYAVHPLHVQVADTYVRPYTANRICIDFEI